jgi:hypothetical protein
MKFAGSHALLIAVHLFAGASSAAAVAAASLSGAAALEPANRYLRTVRNTLSEENQAKVDAQVDDWGKEIQAWDYGPALDKESVTIVVSSPECGKVREGDGPYDFPVMTYLQQTREKSGILIGYDRAGTTSTDKRDEYSWENFAELQKTGAGSQGPDVLYYGLNETLWWKAYVSAVKAELRMLCETNPGREIHMIAIDGGAISKVEQSRLPNILAMGQIDNELFGVKCTAGIKYRSMPLKEYIQSYDKCHVYKTEEECGPNNSDVIRCRWYKHQKICLMEFDPKMDCKPEAVSRAEEPQGGSQGSQVDSTSIVEANVDSTSTVEANVDDNDLSDSNVGSSNTST